MGWPLKNRQRHVQALQADCAQGRWLVTRSVAFISGARRRKRSNLTVQCETEDDEATQEEAQRGQEVVQRDMKTDSKKLVNCWPL